MAHTLDIFGRGLVATPRSRAVSGKSDEKALAEDWKTVGNDLSQAMQMTSKALND